MLSYHCDYATQNKTAELKCCFHLQNLKKETSTYFCYINFFYLMNVIFSKYNFLSFSSAVSIF